MSNTEEPRDFRDDEDVDETVDLIRVASREEARKLYVTCAMTAYQQGRCDMLADLIRRQMISETHP